MSASNINTERFYEYNNEVIDIIGMVLCINREEAKDMAKASEKTIQRGFDQNQIPPEPARAIITSHHKSRLDIVL